MMTDVSVRHAIYQALDDVPFQFGSEQRRQIIDAIIGRLEKLGE
jgi:hypothetical protein